MHYLNSFRPLCSNSQGLRAISKYGFPRFVDASCRREPDFQSCFPSISALCRGAMFAPRLRIGDSVVYVTVKGTYEPARFTHWRLVAILRVVERFESHKQAAAWYQQNDLPLPSNCMVEGNYPVPYDATIGVRPANRFGDGLSNDEILRKWDLNYRLRARKNGVLLACDAQFLELEHPPIISEQSMVQIFGRIPPTRTPPAICEREYNALCALAVQTLGLSSAFTQGQK